MIDFYIGHGDDDDHEPEIQEAEEVDISDDERMVRRLGEENEDVAIIAGSGADVALFPWSMADQGHQPEPEYSADIATLCALEMEKAAPASVAEGSEGQSQA